MKTLSKTARAINNLWKVSLNSFLFMMMMVRVFPDNMRILMTYLTVCMITQQSQNTDRNGANSFNPEGKYLRKDLDFLLSLLLITTYYYQGSHQNKKSKTIKILAQIFSFWVEGVCSICVGALGLLGNHLFSHVYHDHHHVIRKHSHYHHNEKERVQGNIPQATDCSCSV